MSITTEHSSRMNTSFFLIVGFLLIVAVLCAGFWVVNLQVSSAGADSSGEVVGFMTSFHQGRKVRLPATSVSAAVAEGAAHEETAAEESAPASTGGEVDIGAVTAAINKGGCPACHTIAGIEGAIGQVGPNLSNIGVDGATRKDGFTAEQYIRESILEPNAFAAPECPFGPCIAGAMPNVALDSAEVDTVVNYLVTLGGEGSQ